MICPSCVLSVSHCWVFSAYGARPKMWSGKKSVVKCCPTERGGDKGAESCEFCLPRHTVCITQPSTETHSPAQRHTARPAVKSNALHGDQNDRLRYDLSEENSSCFFLLFDKTYLSWPDTQVAKGQTIGKVNKGFNVQIDRMRNISKLIWQSFENIFCFMNISVSFMDSELRYTS